MEFRTIVPLPTAAPTITPATHALVLGSCFAEHVGERLRTALGAEQCCVNPFGVLYNPVSIARALQLLLDLPAGIDDRTSPWLDDAIFEGRDGLWHSWLHSTHYSAPTREECRRRCAETLAEARRVLDKANLLVVTFGTSRHYALADGTVVANCHKELASRFTEHDSTADEIVATWRPLLERLHQLRPALEVVFTVSPYRYKKYGFHASQLAKSRLLLAVDALLSAPALSATPSNSFATPSAPSATPSNSSATPSAPFATPSAPSAAPTYFPAYEIVLDELRDYRFYKPDMLHPSEQAVEYIWERFREWAFTPEAQTHYQQRHKEQKALNHHVFHN